jgi:hypothetical protein
MDVENTTVSESYYPVWFIFVKCPEQVYANRQNIDEWFQWGGRWLTADECKISSGVGEMLKKLDSGYDWQSFKYNKLLKFTL